MTMQKLMLGTALLLAAGLTACQKPTAEPAPAVETTTETTMPAPEAVAPDAAVSAPAETVPPVGEPATDHGNTDHGNTDH